MAYAAEQGDTAPGVALALDARLTAIATALRRGGSGAARAWGSSMADLLTDRAARHTLATERARPSRVPPGMPIGSLSGDLGDGE